MSVSSSQVHYAQIGSCQNVVSGKTRCAISPDDCEPARNEDGEKWYSAIRMEEKVESGSASGSAAACRCEETLIGACVFVGGKQMTYECAPRTTRSVTSGSSSSTATSSSDEEQDNDVDNNNDDDNEDYCRQEEDDDGNILDPSYEFLPANSAGTNCFCDALHSIEDDSVTGRSSSRTRYGACYIPPNKNNNNNKNDDTEDNKFFCAYSSEYCTGDHVWIHPNDVPTIRGDNGGDGDGAKDTGTVTNYCNCETTRIGGCVGGFHDFHCGISEADCWNTMFVPPIPLKVAHNHACLLCKETMTIHPEQDEIDTMEFQNEDTTTTTTSSSNSSNSNSNSNSSITKAGAIGIGIGVLVLVTFMVLISMTCLYIRKKKNRQQKKTNKDNDDDDHDDDNKKKHDETDTDNNNGDEVPVVGIPSSSLSNDKNDCIIPEIS